MNGTFVQTALTNAVLQGATLLGKAALLLTLARYLPVSDVGVFGLLFATINVAMYALGLDFSTFAARELLSASREAVPHLLRSQLSLHGTAYCIVLPLLLLVFVLGTLPWSLALWFYVLLVLEHLGQELQRVLITLQRSSQAGLVLFIRQGLWGFLLAASMIAWSETRSLDSVLLAWSACEAVGLGLGVLLIRDLPWAGAFSKPTDWAWVRRGLKVALPFLAATLAAAAMGTIDRYALRHFWGNDAVGVFTFFIFVRSAIQGLIDLGIVFVLQPRIVTARQSGDHATYRRLMLGLFAGVLACTVVLSALAAVLIEPVLAVVGRPEYAKELPAFWMVLGLTVVAALSDVPQAALYARHLDRAIVACALLGLATAIAANLLLVPRFGIVGAAAATTCGFAAVGLGKAWVLATAK